MPEELTMVPVGNTADHTVWKDPEGRHYTLDGPLDEGELAEVEWDRAPVLLTPTRWSEEEGERLVEWMKAVERGE